jgi:hypothetical protein
MYTGSVTAKTAEMLGYIKVRSKQCDGCGCGRKDCVIKDLSNEERDRIQHKFDLMYKAFAYDVGETL